MSLFAVHGCLCCCPAGARRGGGRGALSSGFLAAAGASGESVAAAESEDGVLGWRKRPLAGETYVVPVALYDRLPKRPPEAVWVQNRCGRDRDCLPSDGQEPSLQNALINAYAWTRLGSGRNAEIFSLPGRALLSRIEGAQTDYVRFTATGSDEQIMRSIQLSKNAGRYGFIGD